jgi:hypothetical protein
MNLLISAPLKRLNTKGFSKNSCTDDMETSDIIDHHPKKSLSLRGFMKALPPAPSPKLGGGVVGCTFQTSGFAGG